MKMTPETSNTFHRCLIYLSIASPMSKRELKYEKKKEWNKQFKKFTAHFVFNVCSRGCCCVGGKNEQCEKTTRIRPEARTLETSAERTRKVRRARAPSGSTIGGQSEMRHTQKTR